MRLCCKEWLNRGHLRALPRVFKLIIVLLGLILVLLFATAIQPKMRVLGVFSLGINYLAETLLVRPLMLERPVLSIGLEPARLPCLSVIGSLLDQRSLILLNFVLVVR